MTFHIGFFIPARNAAVVVNPSASGRCSDCSKTATEKIQFPGGVILFSVPSGPNERQPIQVS